MDKEKLKSLGFTKYDKQLAFIFKKDILKKFNGPIAILIHDYTSPHIEGSNLAFCFLARIGNELYSLKLDNTEIIPIGFKHIYSDISEDICEYLGINTNLDDLLSVAPELVKAIIPKLNSKSARK